MAIELDDATKSKLTETGKLSDAQVVKIEAGAKSASPATTVARNIEALAKRISPEGLVAIAQKDGGASIITTVSKDLDDLAEAGLKEEHLVRLLVETERETGYVLVSKRLGKLREAKHSPEDIISLAASATKKENVDTVLTKAGVSTPTEDNIKNATAELRRTMGASTFSSDPLKLIVKAAETNGAVLKEAINEDESKRIVAEIVSNLQQPDLRLAATKQIAGDKKFGLEQAQAELKKADAALKEMGNIVKALNSGEGDKAVDVAVPKLKAQIAIVEGAYLTEWAGFKTKRVFDDITNPDSKRAVEERLGGNEGFKVEEAQKERLTATADKTLADLRSYIENNPSLPTLIAGKISHAKETLIAGYGEEAAEKKINVLIGGIENREAKATIYQNMRGNFKQTFLDRVVQRAEHNLTKFIAENRAEQNPHTVIAEEMSKVETRFEEAGIPKVAAKPVIEKALKGIDDDNLKLSVARQLEGEKDVDPTKAATLLKVEKIRLRKTIEASEAEGPDAIAAKMAEVTADVQKAWLDKTDSVIGEAIDEHVTDPDVGAVVKARLTGDTELTVEAAKQKRESGPTTKADESPAGDEQGKGVLSKLLSMFR